MIIPDKEYFEHPIVTPRYLSKNWPEFYEYLRKEYPDIKSIGAALYMWRHNMKSSPKCPVCGKETRFFGYTKGYGVCCSTKCSNSYSAKKYKTKEVCLEKYGVDNPSKNKDVKNKAKETSLKKYGVDNPSKSQEIKDKISRSCLERFGVRCSFQNQDVKYKIKETLKENHGVTSPLQDEEIKKKMIESRKKKFLDKYNDILDVVYGDDIIYTCLCPHPGSCDKCTAKTYNIPGSAYHDRKRNGTEKCTNLLPFNSDRHKGTTVELFVRKLLDEYNIEYKTNVRNIIPPQELDIYIPSKKIGIECNGIYWHSSDNKNHDYHVNKFEKCKTNDIQLITVWEDWIANKPHQLKNIILSKLGIYGIRIPARKCTIRQISAKESNILLDNNHIQGGCSGSCRYGLYNKDNKLVSTMVFAKNRNKVLGGKKDNSAWELVRYCCEGGVQIIGGAEKMLKHFIEDYNPKMIYSFSSNDISNGNLYKKLRFEERGINSSYWYIESRTMKRYHRSAYTKDAIVKKGWKENKNGWTESEVMKEHGYFQVYDSGQTKWEYKIVE